MKIFNSIKFKIAAYRPLFTFTWLKFDKPNVTFKERMRMYLENFRLDQIQNGCLSDTIYFHIADFWSTVLDH